MAPNTINHPRPCLLIYLLLIVNMLSPTLKVLISLKGKSIYNPTHTVSANDMNIVTTGKDSVPVSIVDIAPASNLIHQKDASFEHLVQTVSKLKGLRTSS